MPVRAYNKLQWNSGDEIILIEEHKWTGVGGIQLMVRNEYTCIRD